MTWGMINCICLRGRCRLWEYLVQTHSPPESGERRFCHVSSTTQRGVTEATPSVYSLGRQRFLQLAALCPTRTAPTSKNFSAAPISGPR